MSEMKKIRAPFSKEVGKSLKAGESVLISGTILVARDAAHKALTEALARGAVAQRLYHPGHRH